MASIFMISAMESVPARINKLPKYGAIVVPTELNACTNTKRLEDVSDGPSTLTYGLIATCNNAKPAAIVKRATRKNANEGRAAAG